MNLELSHNSNRGPSVHELCSAILFHDTTQHNSNTSRIKLSVFPMLHCSVTTVLSSGCMVMLQSNLIYNIHKRVNVHKIQLGCYLLGLWQLVRNVDGINEWSGQNRWISQTNMQQVTQTMQVRKCMSKQKHHIVLGSNSQESALNKINPRSLCW